MNAWKRYALIVACAGGLVCAGCGGSPSRSAWLGVNTCLGQPVRANTTAPDAARLQQSFQAVNELKAPLVRDVAMNWGLLQPRQDQEPDFSLPDQFVRAAGRADSELLVVFRGIPGWASLNADGKGVDLGLPPRQHAEAFTRFVSKFVDRYDGDGSHGMADVTRAVHAYQFMSEMEDIPTADYAYWLKLFYQAVKAADDRSVVVLGALRSPGVRAFDETGDYPRYFERLLADSELQGPGYPYFDAVAFDHFPARYPGRPVFDDALAYLRQTMADHGLSKPVWLTALGQTGEGKSEAAQADNLVKWAVKARTLGIERVYWYGLDDQADAIAPAAVNSGLLRVARKDVAAGPKPAFEAMRRLIAETRERPVVTRRAEGLYMLTGKGDPRYILWKQESYDPTQLLIPGWWSVEKFPGPKVVRQGTEIQLTGSPVLIERAVSPFIH